MTARRLFALQKLSIARFICHGDFSLFIIFYSFTLNPPFFLMDIFLCYYHTMYGLKKDIVFLRILRQILLFFGIWDIIKTVYFPDNAP